MKKSDRKLTVETVFEEFVNWKRQTITPTTLDNYIIAYQIFCSETGVSDEPLEVLNKTLVEEWKFNRLNSSSPVSSSNQYIGAVRVFLYWLMEMDYIPSFSIKLISNKEPTEVPRYTEEEIKALLEKPKKSDTFTQWREWMIVNLMMSTGVRISSITSLKMDDISEDTITFTHTKTHKVLRLPISPSLRNSLDTYLNTWEISSAYLIPTYQGLKSDPNPLRHELKDYCNERGVEYKGFHAFRRAFAYLLWKAGTDIVKIESWLGHSKIETTRQYIGKLNGQDLIGTHIPLDMLMSKKIRRK